MSEEKPRSAPAAESNPELAAPNVELVTMPGTDMVYSVTAALTKEQKGMAVACLKAAQGGRKYMVALSEIWGGDLAVPTRAEIIAWEVEGIVPSRLQQLVANRIIDGEYTDRVLAPFEAASTALVDRLTDADAVKAEKLFNLNGSYMITQKAAADVQQGRRLKMKVGKITFKAPVGGDAQQEVTYKEAEVDGRGR